MELSKSDAGSQTLTVIVPKRPEAGTGILIINEYDEILVNIRLKEYDPVNGGKWQIPGGHLEWRESFKECGQREVNEECGVDIPAERYRFITVINSVDVDIDFHSIDIWLGVEVKKEEF